MMKKVYKFKYLIITCLIYTSLYFLYILSNDIPVRPTGFYASATETILENNFSIGSSLDNYGDGIPLVYPPLGFYISAILSLMFGGVMKVFKFFPGLFYILQALLLYVFLIKWTGKHKHSLFSFLFFVFMPQMVSRSVYGDGIITTISGVFMISSWIFALYSQDRAYRYDILGGLMVGASLASHPIIGLFCALSYPFILHSSIGNRYDFFNKITTSVISSLFIVLPWIITAIYFHGIDPLIAGSADSKSGLSVFVDPESVISYIVGNYTGGTRWNVALSLVPYGASVIYFFVKRRYYIIFLLLVSIIAGKGHPLVSSFLVATCAGFFTGDILDKLFSDRYKRLQYHSTFLVYLMLLSFLCYGIFTKDHGHNKEMYTWIKNNTSLKSSFVMTGAAEDLPFFTNRNITYPGLGAEWIPSDTHVNGQKENRDKKRKLFGCSSDQCLPESLCDLNESTYLIYSSGKYSELKLRVDVENYFDKQYSDNQYTIVMPKYDIVCDN